MRKILNVLLLTFSLASCVSAPALAGTWRRDARGWWYQNNDGSYQNNGWFRDYDNRYYYFGADGYMYADTVTPDGYYVGADGAYVPGGKASSYDLKNLVSKTDLSEAELFFSYYEDLADKGDYYEIQGHIVVPVETDTDITAGKKAGDRVSVVTNEVAGIQNTYTLERLGGILFIDQEYSSDRQRNGRWRYIGSNDIFLAKVIYSGPIRIYKNAASSEYDYDANRMRSASIAGIVSGAKCNIGSTPSNLYCGSGLKAVFDNNGYVISLSQGYRP